MDRHKYYSVASIKSKGSGKIVGARVLNLESRDMSDLSIEQLIYALKKDVKIRNLSLNSSGDKIDWIQGVSDRYPCICSETSQIIDNENSIIVLGKMKDKDLYIVANYLGNVANIESSRLIEYGTHNTLANCKIVTKKGNKYVASIAGEINEIDMEPEFDYNGYDGVLTVRLPDFNLTKLEIPKMIKGYSVRTLNEFYVVPRSRADKIKHLIMPESLDIYHEGGIFEWIKNITTLEIKGRIGRGYGCEDNKGLSKLRKVIINSTNSTYNMFKGLKNLREIEIKNKPNKWGREAFSGCISIDINDVLHEGLQEIDFKAFNGCTQIQEVNLPESLNILDNTAFHGCTNIKVLRINSNKLQLQGGFNGKNRELLRDSLNAEIHCPYEFPISMLRDNVAKHVKIVRDEPKFELDELKRREVKANLIGLSINPLDIANNKETVLGFMRIIDRDSWREKIIECIKDDIKNGSWNEHIIEYKGIYVKIMLGKGFRIPYRKGMDIRIGQKACYIIEHNKNVFKNIHIMAIDKDIITDRVTKGMEIKDGHIISISQKSINEDVRKIVSIKERGNKAIIEFKGNRELEVVLV